MEEFKTVIFDRIQNLVAESLIIYDPIAYAAKWDSLRAYVDTIVQNMKSFSSESVASSSQKLDHLEEKLSFVAAKQEEIDVQLKTVVARQDEMCFDLKAIIRAFESKIVGFRILQTLLFFFFYIFS